MRIFVKIIFLLFICKIGYAREYEGLIRAFSTSGGVQYPAVVSVKVYYQQNGEWTFYNPNNVPYIGWTHSNFGIQNDIYNGGFCVESVSGDETDVLFPTIPYDLACQGIMLVIGGKAVEWHWELNGDTSFLLNMDTGDLTVNKQTLNYSWTGGDSWTSHVILARNSFNGGQIQIGNNSPVTVPDNSYYVTSLDYQTSLTALPDQSAANYYVWNSWGGTETSLTKQVYLSDIKITAEFDPAERILFSECSVMVNQNIYMVPNEIFRAKKDLNISIALNSDVYNSMVTTFNNWLKNGNYYDNQRTISYTSTAQQNTTFSVSRTYVRPTNEYRQQHYSTAVGQPITIYWDDHNLASIRYNIWRRVRHNGVTGNPVLLATVSHGTTSYTDYDYLLTSYYSDDLIWYDVRAEYIPTGLSSDEDYMAVYGRLDPSIEKGNNSARILLIPSDYSLTSYPNPFNPTTVIRYSMPEAGQVSLKIYNILSQEVANLVEETKAAGVHTVNFNANNLSTGIYIARLQAGAKVISIKLQLVK